MSKRFAVVNLFAAQLLAANACGGEADPCEGSPPELSACENGFFFSDCGGSESPRLACLGSDCRWFTGGCIASGYAGSDCPSDEVCCHGNWPYTDGDQIDSLFPRLYALGVAPWDRSTFTVLQAEIDSSLASGPAVVTCLGTPLPLSGTSPCDSTELGMSAVVFDTLALFIGDFVSEQGWQIWIEVLPVEPGGMGARLCAARYTDSRVSECPEPEVVCAIGGTVKLSSWPTDEAATVGLTVSFTADFDAGLEMQGSASIEPPL